MWGENKDDRSKKEEYDLFVVNAVRDYTLVSFRFGKQIQDKHTG